MPTFAFASQPPSQVEADAVAVFAVKGPQGAEPGADARALAEAVDVDLGAQLGRIHFEGELGSCARIPTRGSAPAGVLLVVGLGEAEKADLVALRKAAGTAARNAAKDSALALVVPGDLVNADVPAHRRAQAVMEGAGLGAYAYTAYRSKPHELPSLDSVTLLPGDGVDGAQAERGFEAGVVLVRATNLARDLVNTPPAGKRPPELADRIAELARAAGLDVKIFDEAELAEGRFGGILGVGQGSSQPPRLVELTYAPADAQGHVVLVGKGITFDTGGLSLKPSTAMTTMKSDMSGAAAVVGAMVTLGELGMRTKVTGLLALAENMPSGDAIRVSDVLTHRNRKTVEVMNTDAEGRLVLADALSYGAESRPDALIDLATLTGAQVVALGNKISGLMGSDEALLADLERAAAETGEGLWRLPLPEEYREHLKSEVADLKNIGRAREAGTIVAGLFLQEFTDGLPWAHLDIAGPAFDENGDTHFTPKGATGVGVRTLVAYLQSREH